MLHRGHIQIIFGPMFSGKTTELIRRVRRYSIARQRCLVIKYAKDTRYSDDGVSTHDRYVPVASVIVFPPSATADAACSNMPSGIRRVAFH